MKITDMCTTKKFIKYSCHYKAEEFLTDIHHQYRCGGIYVIHNKTNGKCYAGSSKDDVGYQVYRQLEGKGKVKIYVDRTHGDDLEICIRPEQDEKRQKKIVAALQRALKINKKGYGALVKMDPG